MDKDVIKTLNQRLEKVRCCSECNRVLEKNLALTAKLAEQKIVLGVYEKGQKVDEQRIQQLEAENNRLIEGICTVDCIYLKADGEQLNHFIDENSRLEKVVIKLQAELARNKNRPAH